MSRANQNTLPHFQTFERPWVRPVRHEDNDVLVALANQDQHAVIAPTHVFVSRGEVVGYVSVGAVPLVLPYFHTTKCQVRDSLYFINHVENLIASLAPQGQDSICVPFVAASPFQPYIEKLGYVNTGPANITFKKVR